jgi:hypothetical protein
MGFDSTSKDAPFNPKLNSLQVPLQEPPQFICHHSANIIKDKPKEDTLDDATLVGRVHPKSQQQNESNLCMAENKKASIHIHKERKKKL